MTLDPPSRRAKRVVVFPESSRRPPQVGASFAPFSTESIR